MAAVTAGTSRVGTADGPSVRGPSPARTAGPAAVERSQATARRARTVRSWPLLVLAAPAAAEVWSGWVGIAQKTGFGLVSPLPGIWSSLHLDTTITLPIGVEAYAAYALRAWLSGGHAVSARTRRFAKWSAICSFALGMAGQVAYHLLGQAGVVRAPWAITTVVSCLPVLVLGMGTALAHMLRADAAVADVRDRETDGPAMLRSPDQFPGGQAWTHQDQTAGREALAVPGASTATRTSWRQDHDAAVRTTAQAARTAQPEIDQVRLIARRLAAAGKPVSRRALRSSGVRGSNESLNALARKTNAELAGAAGPPAQP
ncbi:MAG TPA: hypothetical protein VMV92_22230 [Streptosporangiaceae bacterium]|nr:hypothetical protein [Streptosporangiaceae bacterium]